MRIDELIQVVTIFLIPLVPAILLYRFVPPKKIEADVNGAISGITFKAGGSTAAYIIFVFLSSFIYNTVTQNDTSYVNSGLKIRLIGDKRALGEFKNQIRSNIEVSFLSGNNILASHSGFRLDPYKDIITSTGLRFDEKNLGKDVRVQVDPFRENFKIVPEKITLGESEIAITMTLSDSTGGDWVVPVDLNYWLYGQQGKTTRIVTMHLLDNRTGGKLSNIHLNPMDIRYLKKAEITAYSIGAADRLKIVENWSPKKTRGVGPKELYDRMKSTEEQVKSLTRISSNELDDTDLVGSTPGEPTLRAGARFLFGITPRIEGIRGGIEPGESVVVLLEFERDATGDPKFEIPISPKTQTVGRRYIYPTERAIFAVTTDETIGISDEALARQYLSADGSVGPIGDPVLRDSPRFRITELNGIPKDSTVLSRYLWNP